MDEFDDSKSQHYISQKELSKEKQKAFAKQRRDEFKKSDFAIKLRARQKELRKIAYENAKKRKKEYEAKVKAGVDTQISADEETLDCQSSEKIFPKLTLVYSAPKELR